MGYIRHNAIVATTWQEESADALVAYASEVGAEAVVGPEVTNGYRTVMIAPDGSKEGWQESDDGNERRRLIREWLDAGGDRGIYFEWIEVVYGDDDSAASIVDSAWGTPSPGAEGANMNDLVQRAKDLAHRAHAGQVDKAGRPYIEHVARVAAACADDPESEAVAWLHDVLEDFGFPMRWATDFPRDTRDSVIRLTRTKRESSADYYALIATDPVALRVKLADIADNANESRLALLDDKTATRLRRKYAKAIAALTGAAGGGR